MTASRPVIALTPGEPAGVGPDLALAVACQPFDGAMVVVGDAEMLAHRARQLGLEIKIEPVPGALPGHQPGRVFVHHIPLQAAVECGRPDPRNAASVVSCLDEAALACLQGRWHAMVTGPVNKAIINDGGIPFTGHTEYLARLTGAELPVMMLATETLKVALTTTHLPLARVPEAITRTRLIRTLEILHHDLRERFDIDEPRILVCGLNPHAGEGGHLGHEEIDVIEPALKDVHELGIDARGPLPADTVFTPGRLASADAVLAMYHDQGLPVLKYAGFGKAVNVTLGLPIIRTSVDHGTALDIAGTGKAEAGSLIAAMTMAARMAESAAP
ncbi:MAG: 4-hydroxythreonine-4-phosphate dehydrogenase [Gammaproteobacteria bacterium SG8_31]|jgi:4-hydroxythreonine-4-phosphate dehydrogenase|nr:MAG: 4-hydroxythreonine-4-phosphate dehydrogenase [Gammaproteobacteria bacterium SG8_31]